MRFNLEILDSLSESTLETYDPTITFRRLEIKLVGLHKQRATLLVRIGDKVKRLTLSQNLTDLVRKNGWSLKETIKNSVIVINQEGIPFLAVKPDMEGGWETV